MGVVCKYRNATLNKFAAVKMIVSKELSEAAMLRFQREGQAAAKLQHPGIVAVHDLGVTEYGDPYMIMDYYEGETLEQLLNRKYQFSMAQLKTIFLQCAEAMQHAHSQGVLHRDLKPSNIMITNLKGDQLVIKILDFGIAKILDENGEFTTTVGLNAGSPLYMSPEQSQGSPLDARADIYSLGCVFYATLVGNPPFKGKNSLETALLHQKDLPLPISQIPHLKGCPANVSSTIMQMLEKDLWKRPQTMKEVVSLLSKEPRAGGKISRKRLIWILVAAAVALIALMAAALSGYVLHTQDVSSKNRLEDLGSNINYKEVMKLFPSIDPARSKLATLVQQKPYRINMPDSFLIDSDLTVLLLDDNLRELLLPRNDIGDIGLRILAQVPNLRLLDLDANLRVTDDGLKSICRSMTITELNLKHTSITDAGMHYLNRMPELIKLHLDETAVTDKGISYLGGLKNLKSLAVPNTGVTNATLEMVPKMWPDLQELKVGSDKISYKGINALKGMPLLSGLSLHHCLDTGTREAQAVTNMNSVVYFESGEEFNDACSEILCTRNNWVEVRLDGPVTEKTLRLFSNQKHLHRFVVAGAKLSKASLQQFHQASPHCSLSIQPSAMMKTFFTPAPR